MKIKKNDLIIRRYQSSDADTIADMINRDEYNFQKGITAAEFDRYVDEPGERIRENTFVAILNSRMVGYVSLCFVKAPDKITVYSYSAVDVDWRRKGIGSILFEFIMEHLKICSEKEAVEIAFVHRVDSRVPGMLKLAKKHEMQKQHESSILRNTVLNQNTFFSLPQGFSFRSPTLMDASDWADIYNRAFNGNKTAENVIHEFKSSEFSSDLYILVLSPLGKPIGFISSVLSENQGRIPTIAVKPEFQGRGIGKALLSEALLRLKDQEAKQVTLSVDIKNEKAQKLYSKFGFSHWAKRSNYCIIFESHC
jgi:ribosomal protein S18 acetylase RimI-like enzyme